MQMAARPCATLMYGVVLLVLCAVEARAASVTYYLQNAAAGATPTAVQGTWHNTASTVTRGMGTKAGVITNNAPQIGSTAADYRRLLARFVGPALAGGEIISGTLQIAIGQAEQSKSANCYPAVHLYLMKSDGTPRSTLLTNYGGHTAGDAEWGTLLTKAGEGFAAPRSITTQTAFANDRMVLEVGGSCTAAAATYFTKIAYGGPGGDLTDGGDANSLTGSITISSVATAAPTPSITTTPTITNTATVTPTPTPQILIASPVDWQVLQRNGNNRADIAISGTYVGSPAGVEAQWNGGAWTTIDAFPSQGTYSGTLTAQPAGDGDLTVRFTDQTSVSVTTAHVRIGTIVILDGQSNPMSALTPQPWSTPAASPHIGASSFTQQGRWQEFSDPVQCGIPGIDSELGCGWGSAWPRFATRFLADQHVPIAIIECAHSGAGIDMVVDPANYLQRPVPYPTPIPTTTPSIYGSCYQRFLAAGGKAEFVILEHGETDGRFYATDQEWYQTRLSQLVTDLHSDFGVRTFIVELVSGWSFFGQMLPDHLDWIRRAQQAVCDTNPYAAGCIEMYDISVEAGVHIDTTTAITKTGDRIWAGVNGSLLHETASDGRGPRCVSAALTGEREMTITFSDATLPLLPATWGNTAAWEVKNNGTLIAVTGVTRPTTITIALALASPPDYSVPITWSYCKGLMCSPDVNPSGTPRGTTTPTPVILTDSDPYLIPADVVVNQPLPTITPTSTFAPTNTSPPTFTPTPTFAPSFTSTAMPTDIPTKTPTATNTPTDTAAPTVTSTATSTWTATPTITPTLRPVQVRSVMWMKIKKPHSVWVMHPKRPDMGYRPQ